VATFVIESYMSRTGTGALDTAAANLRAAIAGLPLSAGRVRYLRSMFVPDDEICFHVIEAPSLEVAVEAARLAGLTPERVVKAEAAGGA
jgi:hypothetical protein